MRISDWSSDVCSSDLRDFGFDAARAQIPYLAALGISHAYLSPILAARSGSMHGYDVVDHDHISPELGGEDGLCRLVAALREHGMGVIVDIVPNHAAVGGHDNARWLEVLEWGRHSPCKFLRHRLGRRRPRAQWPRCRAISRQAVWRGAR